VRKLRDRHIFAGAALLGLMLTQPQQASAQGNPYPIGPIQTLTGLPMKIGGYTSYTANFVAAGSTTDLTFAFRDDPGFIGFDDVSLTDTTTSTAVPILNGAFELGNTGSGLPVDWTFDNVFGAEFGGLVAAGSSGHCSNLGAHSGSNLWCDGAVGSYDAIDQIVATTVGNAYAITYWAGVTGNAMGNTNYQELCTNGADAAGPGIGCNAIDLAVYAEAGLPSSGDTPEPASILLFATGLAGLLSRRRASVSPRR
jgi:PEP-CTERM motif